MEKRYFDGNRVYEVRRRLRPKSDSWREWAVYSLTWTINADRIMTQRVKRVSSSYLPVRLTHAQAQADLDAWALKNKLKEIMADE